MSDQGKASSNGRNGRRRGGGRRSRRGRSPAEYKRQVEEQLLGIRSDNGRSRLEERVRAAHGGPNFLRVYREYTKSFGLPESLGLLFLLLDLEDEREVVRVVGALGKLAPDAGQDQRSLLKSRMRNLEMSASTDALAAAAEQLVGQL